MNHKPLLSWRYSCFFPLCFENIWSGRIRCYFACTLRACSFRNREIWVLGYLVDSRGIRPDSDKVFAVKRFAMPISAKPLQCFLGLCSYFWQFIRNFTQIAEPVPFVAISRSSGRWTKRTLFLFWKHHLRWPLFSVAFLHVCQLKSTQMQLTVALVLC